jgi:Zn-dependent peptidase ImmA (M78 family)
MFELVFPEIIINWEHDPLCPQESKEFFNSINSSVVDNIGRVVGEILVNPKEDEVEAIYLIELNDPKMKMTLSKTARIALYGDDKEPMITIDTECYNNVKKGNPKALFPIYHELGHYFSKHMEERSVDEEEKYREERKNAIDKGDLFWQEEEADAFVAHYLNLEDILKHLNSRKNYYLQLKKRKMIPAQIVNPQILELDNRISAIKQHYPEYKMKKSVWLS